MDRLELGERVAVEFPFQFLLMQQYTPGEFIEAIVLSSIVEAEIVDS
jgi:hypothetical protein